MIVFLELIVTLIAIIALPLMFFVERKFDEMDEEWEETLKPDEDSH